MFYVNFFKALASYNINYLLVGGLAMNLHGVPRMTMDVDIVIALDSNNLSKFIDCISSLGLHPSVPVSLADLANPAEREVLFKEKNLIALSLISRTPVIPTVDIVIHHPLNFELAFANKVERNLAGTPVMVASIEDMITMKKFAGRKQDLADISHLQIFLKDIK